MMQGFRAFAPWKLNRLSFSKLGGPNHPQTLSGIETRSKAAPRFELGVRDLQSPALPLGHAAITKADEIAPVLVD